MEKNGHVVAVINVPRGTGVLEVPWNCNYCLLAIKGALRAPLAGALRAEGFALIFRLLGALMAGTLRAPDAR